MAEASAKIRYPRRHLIRGILRVIGRMLVRLLARFSLTGQEKFPAKGPLIIIANHVDNSDGLLLLLFAPYLAEVMVAADLPFPWYVRVLLALYGHIPVMRGAADGVATRRALSVLEQGGVVILFPEGGTWRAAGKPIHTGAAWMSQKTQTPVLPVGLMGTRKALVNAFRLKRPRVGLVVGDVLPPVAPSPEGVYDKALLQRSVDAMMQQVEALIPPEDRQQVIPFDKLRFDFQVVLSDGAGRPAVLTQALSPEQAEMLGKVYYDIDLMKTLRDSMKLPVQPLLEPGKAQDAAAVARALRVMFAYLDNDYPYFFSYRFGKEPGAVIRGGFEQIYHLVQSDGVRQVTLTPRASPLKEVKADRVL